VVELAACTAVKFGFPNDEALHGYRLYAAGLNHYQLHEVLDGAWLTHVRTVEAAHSRAPEAPSRNARHFVFTFHDSTLEAIAVDVSWSDALDPWRTSSGAGVSVVVNGVVEERSGT
jgi:hypothetical protein